MTNHLRRQVGYWLAVTLGALSLAGGALLLTASRSFFNASSFAESTAASLSDDGVAAYVADRVTDTVIRQRPDLVAVRPLILATSKSVVASEPFRALVRTAAHKTHQAVLSETGRQIALSLPDVEVLLRGAIQQASPELAARIPQDVDTMIASLRAGSRTELVVDLWRLGARMRWEALGLQVAGWLLLTVAVLIAPFHRRGLVRCGFVLIVCGLAVASLLPIGSLIAAAYFSDPLLQGAAAGLWQSYMAGLRTWGIFLAGFGVLLAAGSASLLEAVDPIPRVQRLSKLLMSPPPSRSGRVVWGALIVAAGLALMAFPLEVATGVVVLAGVGAVYVGMRELFRLVLESVAASPEAQLDLGPWSSTKRASLVIAVCVVLAVGWIVTRHPAITPIEAKSSTCNGHAELCRLRVDEVVFAGTHNAMSHAQIPDWMFPHHQAGISEQLRDGVRAMLIDVHYGFPGADRVKTDLTGLSRGTLEQAVGAEGVQAAERIRDRLTGVNEDRRELYLCHGYCELGAYELEPVLGQIRDFLLENPNEVLMLIVEDYVSPDDLAGAFEQSGLGELVFFGPANPWPTLGALVSSGQRVVVFIESGRPGVPWLRPAFEHLQETPYSFHKAEEMSCQANRGETRGSLFLVNHWIETTPAPRPSNAQIVNKYDFLLDRARRCSKERGQDVNVLAVDFYQTGDLFSVVEELNGVELVSEPTVE